MNRLLTIKLDNGNTFEAKAPAELTLNPHDICVFRRDFYTDAGEFTREITTPPEGIDWDTLPVILHVADNHELATLNDNFVRSRGAMKTAREWVHTLRLDMKLLNAHYSLDGKIIIIQFSADGRVDFRELVKELSRALSTRIELRQIGVRDETGIYGGIAVCGQTLCCSRFLKEFNSINVRMAKEQDLSLTPATISGACGRLKCCLKFEHEGYRELERDMPRRGSWCETPQGRGRICDRNLLTRKVSVQLESGNVAHFDNSEITQSQERSERPPQRGGSRSNQEQENQEPRPPRRDRKNRSGRPPRDNNNPPSGEENPQKEQ